MLNSKVFKYKLIIKELHLDTFGHVNNATYLQLLEQARWEFLNEHGFGLKAILKLGIGPVILECNIKFLKELLLRQPITIESQVTSFEDKIGVIKQDILNEENILCSTANIVFGFFDTKARKLITPSKEWLAAIGIQ